MTDVRMYYADTLEAVIGESFKGQDLTFVLLNSEKITGKNEEIAMKYIHKQDPGIAVGWCSGQEGFGAEVEDRRQTYKRNKERGRGTLVPVVVTTLPSRSGGLLSWFAETRERAAIRRVSALEQEWPRGSASNLGALLRYLRHSSPKARETAALGIAEYLPVIVRQSGRGQVETAVQALLDALRSEDDGAVLFNIGSALGNTDRLTTPGRLLDTLKGRSGADVMKVAEGLSALRPTPYRSELLEALNHIGTPPD